MNKGSYFTGPTLLRAYKRYQECPAATKYHELNKRLSVNRFNNFSKLIKLTKTNVTVDRINSDSPVLMKNITNAFNT